MKIHILVVIFYRSIYNILTSLLEKVAWLKVRGKLRSRNPFKWKHLLTYRAFFLLLSQQEVLSISDKDGVWEKHLRESFFRSLSIWPFLH